MQFVDWLRRREPKQRSRVGQTITFDLTQEGNSVTIEADGINRHFAVEGIELPSEVDASFAVWGLLALAMEEGFNLRFNQPIDPQVARNAERLSQIWEMWLPSRYRSISVSGKGQWSRPQRVRLPRASLYSGGVDSTFSLLQNRDPKQEGFAVTVCGVDKVDVRNFEALLAKTAPILQSLNYRRILVSSNVKRKPSSLTHGFTLASSLFLLSDIFQYGTFSSDWTQAADLVVFPWGNNHVTNRYFAGSDFAVQTLDADIGRTEKIAAISPRVDLRHMSFCRAASIIPANCGRCTKCIRTKANFLVATGNIPEIFIDNFFEGRELRKLLKHRNERVELFDLYFYAKEHQRLGVIPELADIIEEYRVG